MYLSPQYSGPTLDIDIILELLAYNFVAVQMQLQILGELCGWP